jgi:MFS family permease
VLGRRRLLVRALLAFPIALVLYGAAPSLPTAALAIVAVGGAYIGVLSGLNTVVQLRAPIEARGRVLGLYMMALGTIYPVGAVVEGALARAVGIRAVTMGAGALLGLLVLAVLVLAPAVPRALDDVPAPEEAPHVPEVAGDAAGADAPVLSAQPLTH